MSEEYETIPLDITDEQFLIIAKKAHEHDLTFNQYVNKVLREFIEENRESLESN